MVDLASSLPLLASFAFIFAIVFGLLAHVRIFQNNVNVVIAVVFAFFAVLSPQVVNMLTGILPFGAIVLVVLFFFILVKKLVGGGVQADSWPIAVSLAISLLLLGVFWNKISPMLPGGIDPTQMLWVVGIVLVMLIFWVAYKHSTTQ